MIENPLTEYMIEHAGERTYNPKRIVREKRNDIFRSSYSELIVGRTSTEAIAIIAKKHGVSEKTVRRVVMKK